MLTSFDAAEPISHYLIPNSTLMQRLVNRFSSGCFLLFLLTSIYGCHSQTQNRPPATAEELSQMNRDFAKAINNKDAAAAASLYTDDAMELPPNEAPFSGRDKIQKYWQDAIASGVSDVSVATLATGSDGDLGYEIGRFQLSVRDSTGKRSVERGKYIELLKRGEDGKWRSTSGIWNSDTLALK